MLCGPGWPHTNSPPASASRVVCATVLGFTVLCTLLVPLGETSLFQVAWGAASHDDLVPYSHPETDT